MIRLGVTGGIGSGKSTVAGMLARFGAGSILDADEVARAVTLPGGAAISALQATFGPEIVTAEGAMDRAYARQRAFADAGFRGQLESVIHPLVKLSFDEAEQSALAQGVPLLIYDIPLLVESGHWRARLDQVLVTDCTSATQIARVHQRNGLPEAQVQAIVSAQASRSMRLSAADFVVFNDGIDLSVLGKQCQQVCTILGLH